MDQESFDALRNELSIEAKNGIDFITAAAVIWLMISMIWTMEYTAYSKSVLTFIVGGLMLPLAFLLSKVYKTNWKVKDNPLDPLGLWLNFAQLFYFPFLVFVLLNSPEYFLMTYVIITAAHFFPYAWYYRETPFAITAGVGSVGSLLITLYLSESQFYLVGFFMTALLVILGAGIWVGYRRKSKQLNR